MQKISMYTHYDVPTPYESEPKQTQTLFYDETLDVITKDTADSQMYGLSQYKHFCFNNVYIVRNEVFMNADYMYSMNLPNAIHIQYNAFRECKKIEEVHAPKALRVEHDVFRKCTSLHTVDMPNTYSVQYGAFMDCIKLNNVRLDNVLTVDEFAFYNCINLKSIDLPNTVTIKANAFERCRALSEINIPKAVNIRWGTFRFCGKLTKLYLPSVAFLDETVFPGNIKEIHFAKANKNIISKLHGYLDKFGAKKASIYFDL